MDDEWKERPRGEPAWLVNPTLGKPVTESKGWVSLDSMVLLSDVQALDNINLDSFFALLVNLADQKRMQIASLLRNLLSPGRGDYRCGGRGPRRDPSGGRHR